MPFRVLAVGEILWDLLPAGRQLGGAPANFIQHAHALGADAGLVSRVGDDELGREAVARLCARGVDTDLVQVDPQAPTGTVGVEIGPDHQPQFTIHENVAWDRLAVEDAALAAVRDADAVCFGSLAQRTAEGAAAVRRLLRAADPGALRIFDINLRPPFVDPEVIRASLELATVLKLNNHELSILAAMLGLGNTEERQLDELIRRYSLRLIALTRGGQGSLLLSAKDRSEQPAVAVEVVDTVGAGDAFTAALVLGLLHRWPLEETNHLAAEVAAFVCTRHGGAPELPSDLNYQRFLPREPAAGRCVSPQESSMTLVPVTAETSYYIACCVGAFCDEAPEKLRWQMQYVAEFGALPLYIGWTETIGLRADGEIVRWSTEGEYIGVRPVEDPVWVRAALVEGSKQYPGLQPLIPARPPDARTCPVCSGAGYPPGLPHIGCSCGGVGWVDAESAG